jgi:hypothetical protein
VDYRILKTAKTAPATVCVGGDVGVVVLGPLVLLGTDLPYAKGGTIVRDQVIRITERFGRVEKWPAGVPADPTRPITFFRSAESSRAKSPIQGFLPFRSGRLI